MVAGKKVPKISWKLIKVPKELHSLIFTLARRQKTSAWRVIQKALAYYTTILRSQHRAALPLEKVSWYTFKISSSVGEFKARPTEKNLQFLEKTCRQIQERLGIDTSRVLFCAQQYYKAQTSKNRMALNDATKIVVSQIIQMVEFEEEGGEE